MKIISWSSAGEVGFYQSLHYFFLMEITHLVQVERITDLNNILQLQIWPIFLSLEVHKNKKKQTVQ